MHPAPSVDGIWCPASGVVGVRRGHTGAVTATTPDRSSPSPDDDARHEAADGLPDHALPAGRRGKLVFLLATLALLASFGVWGYAYSGAADRPPPDLLSDRTFADRAEEICAAALVDIDALPNALDADDGAERADQVRVATARFEAMVADLQAMVGGNDRDLEIETGWLVDWRLLVEDRYRYADAIETDPDAQFYLTDTGIGERLDRRITRMADTNEMYSCAAPEDVG